MEDLSLATADRYETKMLHDVKNTARVRAPPRPEPPIFGRESMEDAISARAAVTDEPDPEDTPTKKASSARAATIEDEIDAFFTIFQRIEPRLHMYLTDDDKNRVRSALFPPTQTVSQRIISDPGATSLAVSVMLTILVLYVCTSHKIRVPYRSSTAGSGRFETVSWNIGRLLRPFSRPH